MNTGLKHADGSINYIAGLRKNIFTIIGKQSGEKVKITTLIQDLVEDMTTASF